MFCTIARELQVKHHALLILTGLRSWLLPLLFISQAPPIYLLLFIAGTYFLQRPCLYCTLLLLLIIVTLFDFQSNWFGDPVHETLSESASGVDSLKASASVVSSLLNETIAAAADFGSQALQRRAGMRWSWGGTSWAWLKEIAQRRELRIRCINTVIRL